MRSWVGCAHFYDSDRSCRPTPSQTIIPGNMEKLRALYPQIEPYDRGQIRVSDVHQLYYEQRESRLTRTATSECRTFTNSITSSAAIRTESRSYFSTVDQARAWIRTID